VPNAGGAYVMRELSAVKDTPELLCRLEPALQRIDSDANVKGTVTRHIDPLLASLPPGCALTGEAIERLKLPADEEAYLVIEQWRRSHPAAFARAAQANLTETLERLVREASQRKSDVWPFWLDSVGAVVPVAGARSGEDAPIEVGRWVSGRKQRLPEIADFGLTPEGAYGLSSEYVQVTFHSRKWQAVRPFPEQADADVLFWEKRSSSGTSQWRISDTMALEDVPSNVLQGLRTFFSTRTFEESGSGKALYQCANRFRLAVMAEHERRLGINEAAVADIVARWCSGEGQVGELDHGVLNAARQALVPPTDAPTI
jgi:hypothetical protein